MLRIRTISEAARYFRSVDPNTCLTEGRIRRLVTSGTVPSRRAGVKYLVALEALEAYLAGDSQPSQDGTPVSGIRKIER